MKGLEFLQENTRRLRTRMGACFPGSHAVFRGHDLHAELKELDWVDLYVFGITGRRLSSEQITMLHAIWVYTSYPDARLWNNRVAALATSARSSANLGVSAALAVSEAMTYGGQAGIRAIHFLIEARKKVEQGAELESLVSSEAGEHRVYGYGRPINSTDERIPHIMELARNLGLDQGPHIRLAFDVERILVVRNPRLKMNYAAVHAALIADMGLSEREYQLLRLPTFLAGMPPCAMEAAGNPEGTLFPIQCEDVVYEGVGKRAWRR
jgi:citrate synthase